MQVHYQYGCLCGHERIYVSGIVDEYENEDICHAVIFEGRGAHWSNWIVEARIVGLLARDTPRGPTVIAPGNDGSVQITDPAGTDWEVIGYGPEMPSNLRRLTCARSIGDYIYVAGMSRQVFRRRWSDGLWERADHGALVPLTSTEISGFLAIDGEVDDLYASGFAGHLWHARNGSWRQIDLPTNLKLRTLSYRDIDDVYVAGSKGLIFRGSGDRWSLVSQDLTSNTFTMSAVFRDRIFLVADHGVLYELQGDALVKVDFEELFFCGFLHSSADSLLALGPRRAKLFNGTSWSELDLPV